MTRLWSAFKTNLPKAWVLFWVAGVSFLLGEITPFALAEMVKAGVVAVGVVR